MHFRQAKLADFIKLNSAALGRSSYRNIAYPLGCAIHELDAAITDDDFILLQDNGDICALVRVSGLINGLCYIDFHVLRAAEAASALKVFIQSLCRKKKARKVYIQLLSYESTELSCLEALGFTQEACLAQQVFLNGYYHDLLVMGIRYQDV